MIRNYLLRKIISDSTLSASEILVLLFIYSRMAEEDCLETKIIEISEHIPYLSQSSVYEAVKTLEKKGYIRIRKVKGSWDKKIYRTDKTNALRGETYLTYKIFKKILKCKEICSSGSALRCFLHLFLRILSEKKTRDNTNGLNYNNIADKLSVKLKISRRTVYRILKRLKENNIIRLSFDKNKFGFPSISVWIPKDLLELSDDFKKKKNAHKQLRSEFLVEKLLRDSKIPKEGNEKEIRDTAELMYQFSEDFDEIGYDEEKETIGIIKRVLSMIGELRPALVNLKINEFIRNPYSNIFVMP